MNSMFCWNMFSFCFDFHKNNRQTETHTHTHTHRVSEWEWERGREKALHEAEANVLGLDVVVSLNITLNLFLLFAIQIFFSKRELREKFNHMRVWFMCLIRIASSFWIRWIFQTNKKDDSDKAALNVLNTQPKSLNVSYMFLFFFFFFDSFLK